MFWNDTEQAQLVHIEWAQKNDIQVECSSQRNTNFGPFTLAGGQCSTRCRILLSFLLSPMVTSSDWMDDVADTSGSNDFSMRCGWAFRAAVKLKEVPWMIKSLDISTQNASWSRYQLATLESSQIGCCSQKAFRWWVPWLNKICSTVLMLNAKAKINM